MTDQDTQQPAHIRPVHADDFAALQASVWQQRTETVNGLILRHILREMGRGRAQGLVAETSGQIVAYGQIARWLRCSEISDLMVLAPYRSQGIGTALIRRLLAHANDEKLDCVEIGVSSDNPRALALYERLGFERAYTRSRPPSDANLPDLIYLRMIMR